MVKQWKLRDILTVEDIQRLEDGVARADTNHSEVVQKIATHESSRSNPHGVTAGQVGAYTKSEVDQKLTANKQATDTALNEHVKLKNNPHGVTAEQVGTYDKKLIDSRIASSLTSSKEYTNQKLTESTAYTDEKISEVKEELKTSTVASANKLQTARRIAGNLFDGTADISISAGQVGAYTKSEVDGKVSGTLNSAKSYTDGVKATIEKSMSSSIESLKTQVQSGSVASANKLATARLINGHEFDGTDDITITASDVGAYTTSEVDSKVSSATSGVQSNLNSHIANKQNPHGVTASQVGTYTKNEIDSKDSSTLSSAKGYADTKKTEATKYADSEISKAKTAITSGNVASASKLATARRISGVLFDGTADISIPANNVGAYTKAEVDSRDSGTLSSAKSYTDSQVGAAKSTIDAINKKLTQDEGEIATLKNKDKFLEDLISGETTQRTKVAKSVEALSSRVVTIENNIGSTNIKSMKSIVDVLASSVTTLEQESTHYSEAITDNETAITKLTKRVATLEVINEYKPKQSLAVTAPYFEKGSSPIYVEKFGRVSFVNGEVKIGMTLYKDQETDGRFKICDIPSWAAPSVSMMSRNIFPKYPADNSTFSNFNLEVNPNGLWLVGNINKYWYLDKGLRFSFQMTWVTNAI